MMVDNNTGWWGNVPILKNDGVKVNGKDDIPYMKWKNKKCSKPPTSNSLLWKIDENCPFISIHR
jgi:hypothetical protein